VTDPLASIRIILCRPSHPGNIGATARAMKAMGLSDLRLVAPLRYPAPEAQAMATSAADVLETARVHSTLAEALEDCGDAYALSARPRDWSPPVLSAREAAGAALARCAQGPVAFVFGNETAGLTNDEIFACQSLVHIPTGPEFASLNLAQAVQIVAYELWLASSTVPAGTQGESMLATVADLEGLHAHVERAALESGFLDPAAPRKLRERFRRLFTRLKLEREEVNMVRGLLRALEARRRNPPEK
jgi:tRNA/rRNA methyltransferase